MAKRPSPSGQPAKVELTVKLVLPRDLLERLTAGETLHSVAQREYGSAALWRGLAAANGIDDPLRLDAGRHLLVPPREEAARLS